MCILLVVVLRVSSSSKGGPFSVHYLYYIAAYYRRNIESFFSDFFWALVCILHIAIGFFFFPFFWRRSWKKNINFLLGKIFYRILIKNLYVKLNYTYLISQVFDPGLFSNFLALCDQSSKVIIQERLSDPKPTNC